MRILSIDIETYSDVDLIKSGVYPYTASSNFEILLFAYAFDDENIAAGIWFSRFGKGEEDGK